MGDLLQLNGRSDAPGPINRVFWAGRDYGDLVSGRIIKFNRDTTCYHL